MRSQAAGKADIGKEIQGRVLWDCPGILYEWSVKLNASSLPDKSD